MVTISNAGDVREEVCGLVDTLNLTPLLKAVSQVMFSPTDSFCTFWNSQHQVNHLKDVMKPNEFDDPERAELIDRIYYPLKINASESPSSRPVYGSAMWMCLRSNPVSRTASPSRRKRLVTQAMLEEPKLT
ncbi:hypothetical protein MAP00_004289 [Monascus purpureus]|nr:hypothetical protein MAP00_004289 [Monascus purpureus]